MVAAMVTRLLARSLCSRNSSKADSQILRRFLARSMSAASPTNTRKKIAIHYATSAGTSQLFAQELQNNLQELFSKTENLESAITVSSLGEMPRVESLDRDALHLFLVSTAGVGEPPGQAVPFFQSLDTAKDDLSEIHFGVFGLGNSAAHPYHYNVAGKTLHASLVNHQAKPWIPLALGDDGDCLEEDFDAWQETIIQRLKEGAMNQESVTGDPGPEPIAGFISPKEVSQSTGSLDATVSTLESSDQQSSTMTFGKRLELVSVDASTSETTRTDLLDSIPTWYHPETQRFKVLKHASLSPQPCANALNELELTIEQPSNAPTRINYEAGDHLVVYPSQPDYLVEAYLNHWGIDVATALHSHVHLSGKNQSDISYPHPTGISLFDTLRYCVDLQSPPSLRLARTLTGRDDIDYKTQIHTPRLSPLVILKQSQNLSQITLEDFLYQVPPLLPRYYSIASSPMLHPNSVSLTYRPIRYVNSQGSPQSGLCTSFFANLQAGSTLLGYINKNPAFRLPRDPSAPVILLAGGCGVAAVRSLVEELLGRRNSNESHSIKTRLYIFLGFRNEADAAYIDLMEAVEPALLDVAYSVSTASPERNRALVSDRLRAQGKVVHDLLTQQGAYLYACGGARTFGAAVQRELHNIYQQVGGCDASQAQAAIQQLVREGRYCEDLAD